MLTGEWSMRARGILTCQTIGRVFRLSRAKRSAAAFQKLVDSQREASNERIACMGGLCIILWRTCRMTESRNGLYTLLNPTIINSRRAKFVFL